MYILHAMIFRKISVYFHFTGTSFWIHCSFSLQNSSWSFPESLDTVNWPCTDPVMPNVSRALPGWQVRKSEASWESKPTGLWLYRVMNYLLCFVAGPGVYHGEIDVSGTAGPQSVTVNTKLIRSAPVYHSTRNREEGGQIHVVFS